MTDFVQELKDYHEFMQWDEDLTEREYVKYYDMTQEQAKEALKNDLEFIICTNGEGELYETEVALCKLVGIELGE